MIALIDYNAGNTASVANALNVLGKEYILTKSESEILKADKIIFPGVGEASYTIKQLHKNNLINLLRIVKKPLLGICLGMQLMYEYSEEGNIPCLGILPGTVKKFDSSKITVPHMGWSEIHFIKESKLFKGIKDCEFFYFANSFYVPLDDYTTSITNHDVDFAASIEKDNIYGVQFHPEKSGDAGLKVLQNFIEM